MLNLAVDDGVAAAAAPDVAAGGAPPLTLPSTTPWVLPLMLPLPRLLQKFRGISTASAVRFEACNNNSNNNNNNAY